MSITSDDGMRTVTYTYLSDGTKRSAIGPDGGFLYRGSLVYSLSPDGSVTLEGAATPEGLLAVLPDGSLLDLWYATDHLGNVRSVVSISDTPAILEEDDYLPFGTRIDEPEQPTLESSRWRYAGKEEQAPLLGDGCDLLDFGARIYDPWTTRWATPDPMAEDYTDASPFCYCAGNPVAFVDPDGKETWVNQNRDSTYSVVGGILNNDNSIYLVDEDNHYILGEDGRKLSIGISMSEFSFYNYEDNSWAVQSVIDPSDMSGIEFARRLASISPYIYFPLARNRSIFDFKETSGTRSAKNRNVNRGMPFQLSDGRVVYASGRDVGNYVAGMVAGKSGWSWFFTRTCFDAYQSYKAGRLDKEPPVSSLPQQAGWTAGFISRQQK